MNRVHLLNTDVPILCLNLTIKKQWFDLILSGKKWEEYRSIKNRQVMRMYEFITNGWLGTSFNLLILRNGYSACSPALAVPIRAFYLRRGINARHPEWGEPTDEEWHFVLGLGKVLSHGTYKTVREWLDWEVTHD